MRMISNENKIGVSCFWDFDGILKGGSLKCIEKKLKIITLAPGGNSKSLQI